MKPLKGKNTSLHPAPWNHPNNRPAKPVARLEPITGTNKFNLVLPQGALDRAILDQKRREREAARLMPSLLKHFK